MGYVGIFLLVFHRQAERAGPRLYGKSWIQRLDRGSKATGVDRGTTYLGLYPNSAIILLGDPGGSHLTSVGHSPLICFIWRPRVLPTSRLLEFWQKKKEK